MLDFLVIAYIVTGIGFIPLFTKESYRVHRAEWSSITSEQASRRTAAWFGWAKSIIWPLFAVMSFGMSAVTREQRAAEAEAAALKAAQQNRLEAQQLLREHSRTVKGAQEILSRHKTSLKTDWDLEFAKISKAKLK